LFFFPSNVFQYEFDSCFQNSSFRHIPSPITLYSQPPRTHSNSAALASPLISVKKRLRHCARMSLTGNAPSRSDSGGEAIQRDRDVISEPAHSFLLDNRLGMGTSRNHRTYRSGGGRYDRPDAADFGLAPLE
jgi:hypothetical protein